MKIIWDSTTPARLLRWSQEGHPLPFSAIRIIERDNGTRHIEMRRIGAIEDSTDWSEVNMPSYLIDLMVRGLLDLENEH